MNEDETSKKKKKVRVEQPTAMAPQFQAIDTSNVTKVSQLFEGKEFCVINGLKHSKQELEKLIVEQGGSIVQNPGRKTFCIVADQTNLRVNNFIKAHIYDVMKSSWLFSCLHAEQVLSRSPADFVHMSADTAKLLSQDFDQFGDSYTQPVTPDILKGIFSSMSEKELLSPLEIYNLEQEYFPNTSQNGIFRPFDVYLDIYLMIGDLDTKISLSSLHLTKSELVFNGANISDSLHDKVTHVIVNSRDLERIDEFRRLNRLRKKKFHLVTEQWVSQSLKDS